MREAIFILTILLVAGPSYAQQAQPSTQAADSRETNLRAYAELMRSDIRTQKVAIITEMMLFSDAEDKAFWPIYREYETELAAINDERMAMIVEYAKGYEQMTDGLADTLAAKALDLSARRNALQAKYHGRFKAAVGAVKAARFLQVEHQLLLLLDLQIAASLPVIQ
jgi:hypothetical protein